MPEGEIFPSLVEEGPCREGEGQGALGESSGDSGRVWGGGGWSGFGHQGGFPAGGWAEVGGGAQTEGGGVQGSEGRGEVVVHRERGAAGLVERPAVDREVWDVSGWGVPPCQRGLSVPDLFRGGRGAGEEAVGRGGLGRHRSPHQGSGPASGDDGGSAAAGSSGGVAASDGPPQYRHLGDGASHARSGPRKAGAPADTKRSAAPGDTAGTPTAIDPAANGTAAIGAAVNGSAANGTAAVGTAGSCTAGISTADLDTTTSRGLA